MEDVSSTASKDTDATSSVTNFFNSLTTEDDMQTEIDLTSTEPEEEPETTGQKQERIHQVNITRSQKEKATSKAGSKLRSTLIQRLVRAKKNKQATSLLVDNKIQKFYDLGFDTEQIHQEIQAWIILHPDQAWESIGGTEKDEEAVDAVTRKRDRVNYADKSSEDEEETEGKSDTPTPTLFPPKKIAKDSDNQGTGKTSANAKKLKQGLNRIDFVPLTQLQKTPTTSPISKNTEQNGGSAQ
jgi:hypothetical protein